MEFQKPHLSLKTALPYLLLVLVFTYLAFTGILGIDFGLHVDEPKILNSVTESFRTGVLLPGWYNYPSVSYGLAVASALPKALGEVGTILSGASGSMAETEAWTQSPTYKLHVRMVFLLVTLLSLVWVFLLICKYRGNTWEALLGAVLLGSSWELMYHARWIAPDGIMMQFAVLAVLLMLTALHSQRTRHIFVYVAAVTAGLCCGTKYPGGILLIPLFLTVFLVKKKDDQRETSIFLLTGILFVGAFFISTPGALLDPVRFVKSVLHEILHYQTGHEGYSVASPLQHAGLLSRYLFLAAFSKYWPIAVFFMGFAVVGVWDTLRRKRQFALYVMALPAVYILYFLTQRVMFVRNVLIVLPFLALLTARGIFFTGGLLKKRCMRVVLGVIVGVLVCVNLVWLTHAAVGIRHKATPAHEKNVLRYVGQHPETRFLMAEKMKNYMDLSKLASYDNIATTPEEADRLILSTSDLSGARQIIANRYGMYGIVSGIFEVNFSYYPMQIRERKILVISIDSARRLGLLE